MDLDWNQPMDQELPLRVATRFVEVVADLGICLRFDVDSLVTDFEYVLQCHSKTLRESKMNVGDEDYLVEVGAACYFGETLRRLNSGLWMGKLETGLENFYTVRIRFGYYLFAPFCWLGYRIWNGEEEGAVEQLVQAVLPSMKDGIDHKRQRIDAMIAEGHTVIDHQHY